MSSSGLCSYKDEVTELNLLLNNSENQRNTAKYKKLIQQVILYMTKGMDMTPLFATIVKAAATGDIVQKKLCYLYLCHYASSHADLALLTINTLKRDSEDKNPLIRGLALRSMGSLRLANLIEYTKDTMVKGLQDCSPYVRRAAVIGCFQLYQLSREDMKGCDIINKLYERLRKDKDLKVKTNCLLVIKEILSGEGGVLSIPSTMAQFLLSRLPAFDEWSQQLALDLLLLHTPESEDEIYKMLNDLDDSLKHANSGVVLGAVRLFLHLTEGIMELRDDIFKRIKVPLLTAVSSKAPEIVYSILCHIDILLYKAPTLFEDNFSTFLCRQNDPLYLKIKKLEILSKLVTETNGKQILNELSYHAKRKDTSSHAISNIAMMALFHPVTAEMCIEKLFSFLNLQNNHITSHTLSAFRDLIIKYDKCNALLPSLVNYLKSDLLPDGKASTIWMLGEFGEEILESPYVLESLIDNIHKEDSSLVKLELLTATAKLFLKRPPECQEMLGHLLEYFIEQEYDMDVRDRALLYYRLLNADLDKAREVICCPRSAQLIDNTNVMMLQSKETLFQEFNTLAVIYGELSSSFLTEENISEKKNVISSEVPNQTSGEDSHETGQDDESNDESLNEPTPKGDISVEDGGSPVTLELTEKPDLPPQTFETLWRKLPEAESYEMEMDQLPDLVEFQRLLTSRRIYTMASTPPDAKPIRYFFYAQTDGFILCEITFDTSTSGYILKSVIKMEDPSHVHSFIELFQNCLADKSTT